MSYTQRNEALLKLWPAIQAKAGYLAAKYNQPEPDDIASELVLAILERAEQVPSFLSQQPAYILNYAQWRWQDRARRERFFDTVGLDEPLPNAPDSSLADELPDPAPTPAEAVACKDEREALAAALGRLPERTRGVIARVYINGESQREIARELGRPESTIRRWATEARRALAAELAG